MITCFWCGAKPSEDNIIFMGDLAPECDRCMRIYEYYAETHLGKSTE